MTTPVAPPSKVAQALEAALDGAALSPVFQPIWTVAGVCWGFEALSRFPNGCPPDAVWALARRRGQAVVLDHRALIGAVETARPLEGTLFLNVSPSDFRNPGWLAGVMEPTRVVWEVTESEALSQEDFRGVRQLQDWGYAVAMDDAGAGHSTMRRLERLRPNIIKVDRPIVQVWAAGRTDPLRRWVDAAQRIGATVIAEGVEEADWVAGLAHEGVAAVQGYAVGRPAPWEAASTAQFPEFSAGG